MISNFLKALTFVSALCFFISSYANNPEWGITTIEEPPAMIHGTFSPDNNSEILLQAIDSDPSFLLHLQDWLGSSISVPLLIYGGEEQYVALRVQAVEYFELTGESYELIRVSYCGGAFWCRAILNMHTCNLNWRNGCYWVF